MVCAMLTRLGISLHYCVSLLRTTSHRDDIARLESSASCVCHASAYYGGLFTKVENVGVQGLSMAISHNACDPVGA